MRRAVAANEGAGPVLLAELAGDPRAGVRVAVARNSASPLELVAGLVRDPDPDVREAARIGLAEVWRECEDLDPEDLALLECALAGDVPT